MRKRSFTQDEKAWGGYSTHSLPTRTAENLPSYVEDKVKEFEGKGYDTDYAWPMAWSIYCKHKEPNSPHCHQKEYLTKQASSIKDAIYDVLHPFMIKIQKIAPSLSDDIESHLWANEEKQARATTLHFTPEILKHIKSGDTSEIEEFCPLLGGSIGEKLNQGNLLEARKLAHTAGDLLLQEVNSAIKALHNFDHMHREASVKRTAGKVKDLLMDTLEPFMEKIHKNAPEIAYEIEDKLMAGDYKDARTLAKANSETLKEVNLAIKAVETLFNHETESTTLLEKHTHELQEVSPENWEDLRDALIAGEANPSVLKIKITPEMKRVYSKIYNELKRVHKHASSVVALSDGDYMSHQGLAQLADMAKTMLENIPEGMEFDDWVEFKIASAVNNLTDVFNYLRFKG